VPAPARGLSMTRRHTALAEDMFGHTLEPGDQVVYPVRQGSALWMQVAVVEGVRANSIHVAMVPYWSSKLRTRSQRTGTVTRLDRVVKLNPSDHVSDWQAP